MIYEPSSLISLEFMIIWQTLGFDSLCMHKETVKNKIVGGMPSLLKQLNLLENSSQIAFYYTCLPTNNILITNESYLLIKACPRESFSKTVY